MILKQIQQNPSDDNINTLVKLNLPLIQRIAYDGNKGSVTAAFLLEYSGYGIYSEPIFLPEQQPKTTVSNNNIRSFPNINEELLNIYPNPVTNGNLSFEYMLFKDAESIKVLDVYGRMLISKPIENNFGLETIDVSSLKQGDYFIIIGELKGRFTIAK